LNLDGFIRKGRESRQIQMLMQTPYLLPCDALDHVGTLSARSPLSDVEPHLCTSRTISKNKPFSLDGFLSW
jgi:hypothetical protein